jgi:hypothetical protein
MKLTKNKRSKVKWTDLMNKRVDKISAKKLKIALLNTTCGGFGDIVMAAKFKKYLEDWYSCEVTIITTEPEKFKSLKIKGIVPLKVKWGGEYSCEYGNYYSTYMNYTIFKFNDTIKYDIIFELPSSTYKFSQSRIQKLIKSSRKDNTYSVSEYNGENYYYDVPLGVGGENLGLLLEDITNVKRHNLIKMPYALAYIVGPDKHYYQGDNIIGESGSTVGRKCIIGFIEMVCKKNYQLHDDFSILVPNWFVEKLLHDQNYKSAFFKYLTKYFPTIILIHNVEGKINYNYLAVGKHKKILYIRGDIFSKPIPRETMISLYKYSVKDILVTGDQSLTDVLSCCRDKNIWYEILDWKHDFAFNLEYLMPNKYYQSVRTSCGTLHGYKYNSDYRKLLKQWDFRKRGKPTINGIINYAIYKKSK